MIIYLATKKTKHCVSVKDDIISINGVKISNRAHYTSYGYREYKTRILT